MAHVVWSSDMNLGILAIDKQHQRIVDYINELDDALHMNKGAERQSQILSVVDETIAYTESHFGFEESLLEDIGYEFIKAHKKIHELFVRKILEYKKRLQEGEDIAGELRATLEHWLIQHIKSEDANYAKHFKKTDAASHHSKKIVMQAHGHDDDSGSLAVRFKRFFRGKH